MRDPYVPEAGKINLWHTDYFHPSKYGSYLSALVHFATITGMNPMTLGAGEQAAADLGHRARRRGEAAARARRRWCPGYDRAGDDGSAFRSRRTRPAGTTTTSTVELRRDRQRRRLAASTPFSYTLERRAGRGRARSAPGASLTISAEGVTTVTYFAVDRAGNAEAPRTLRVSIDRTPPAITGMPAASCSLWPPNNKMVAGRHRCWPPMAPRASRRSAWPL